MATTKKEKASSYTLTTTARGIVEEGHGLLSMTRTAVVEQAIIEWGLKHLTPLMYDLHETITHLRASGGHHAAQTRPRS
jgi:hypothetical protein